MRKYLIFHAFIVQIRSQQRTHFFCVLCEPWWMNLGGKLEREFVKYFKVLNSTLLIHLRTLIILQSQKKVLRYSWEMGRSLTFKSWESRQSSLLSNEKSYEINPRMILELKWNFDIAHSISCKQLFISSAKSAKVREKDNSVIEASSMSRIMNLVALIMKIEKKHAQWLHINNSLTMI